MLGPEEQIRNCLVAVESHFFRSRAGLVLYPGSFGEIAALLVEKPENDIRARRDPRFGEDQPAAGYQNARDFAEKSHGRSEVMQHVQPENVCDAVRSKRKSLRVCNGVEPGTPDEVRRENVRRELLEKTRAGAYFNRDPVWFARGDQAREKFVVVDAPQNGFLFPNAAMP